MSELPRISVVTPSYNQGKYLRETILSILRQGYQNLEYIIIDGGSTDESVEIIKEYADHLAYWVSEPDNGQSHAINKGFRRATGEIVCWINSDDLMMPNALIIVSEEFKKNKRLEVLMGWTLRIDQESNVLFNHFIPRQIPLLSFLGFYVIPQQSWYWKREMFDHVGYLDETIHTCMDVDYQIRQFLSRPKIKNVKNILGAFRQHDGTKTATSTLWKNDFAKLEKRYKLINYRSGNSVGRLLYRIMKTVNGNYISQYLFEKRWKGHHYMEIFK